MATQGHATFDGDHQMPKTYLIGRTKSGAIVARSSARDQGYTHAATHPDHVRGEVIPTSGANFSRSAAGAARVWASNDYSGKAGPPELVELQRVDAKTYKALTGKS